MKFLRDKRSNKTKAWCYVKLFFVSPFFPSPLLLFLSIYLSVLRYILPSSDLFPPPISSLAALMSRTAFSPPCLGEIHVLVRTRGCYKGNLNSWKGDSSVYYCLLQTNDNCNSLLELCAISYDEGLCVI